MKQKKITALLVVAAMMLQLAGCGAKPTEPKQSDAAPSQSEQTLKPEETKSEAEVQPVEGGTLSISASIPTTMEWTQIRGIMEIAYFSTIYETLMRYGADGTPEPYLLESITPDAEALTWTMKLKDGIKFSDGSPLDAEALAWNLSYYKENGILASSYYANFESAEIVDETTVVCKFTNWDALFDYALCRTTLIASKKAFDEKGAEELAKNPVGTGPFVLKDYTADVSMEMERNADYWQGKVKLDSIKLVKYQQELVAAAALQNGDIQAMTTESYNIVNQLVGSGTDLVNYTSAISSYAYTLCFNCKDPKDPLSNLKVREAVSYAIDTKAINDALTYGYGKTSSQWALEGTPLYAKDVEGQPYDLEKAKELMKEAGYEKGFDTTITMPSLPGLAKDVGQVIADQLSKININVTLRPIEGAAYVNYIGGWENGMLLHTMGLEAGAAAQYSTTFINNIAFGLGMNAFTISDELDTLSRAITTSKTQDELVANTHKVAKEVFDNNVLCKVILVTTGVSFVSPELKDSNYCTVQNLRYDVWNAWLEK